jgi:hypothetical protein
MMSIRVSVALALTGMSLPAGPNLGGLHQPRCRLVQDDSPALGLRVPAFVLFLGRLLRLGNGESGDVGDK